MVDHQRYLQLAKRSQSKLETIQNQVGELSNYKSSLEPEIITLETKLRQLKEEETALSKLLADLSNSQQQIEILISELNTEIEHLRERKVKLHQSLTILNQKKVLNPIFPIKSIQVRYSELFA